jgi:tRNA(fMet)-specific endonuclease VapC
MLSLDTDSVSLLQAAPGPEGLRLTERLAADGRPANVSIVTFEEQMRGRLAYCARAKTPEQYGEAARRLSQALDFYRGRHLLPFDAAAAAEFDRLKAAKVRVGTNDLRIAAIARSRDARLLTRNLSDFRRVPGLRAEDWSA